MTVSLRAHSAAVEELKLAVASLQMQNRLLAEDWDLLRAKVVSALTSEDEIAHGEAVVESRLGRMLEMNVCAYCGSEWPCRTQRGVDRLLAVLESLR